MQAKLRKEKAEVTGKVTEKKKAPVEEAPMPSYMREEPTEAAPKSAVSYDKDEKAKNYRDMLQAQIEIKKASAAKEKELRRGGTGLQTETMSREADRVQEEEIASKGMMSKDRLAAKQIQEFNQHIAQQKAANKAAKKGVSSEMPEPVAPIEPEQPKGMPLGGYEDEEKAMKKEKAMKLKEALQQQMAEDKAKKLEEKQMRMGYKQ